MKYLGFAVFLVLSFCFSVVAQQSVTPSLPKTFNIQDDKFSEEDSIREVVFISILKPRLQNKDSQHTVYYIAVNDNENPSDSLLKKLRTQKGNFEKDSECIIEDGLVVNKTTKEHGVRLEISKIQWVNKNEVTLSAGSYTGNMASDSCKYTLKRIGDLWRITSTSECYIS